MVILRALGRCWGELSDDGRILELRRQDTRVARIDLVESARQGRVVYAPPVREQPVKRLQKVAVSAAGA